MTKDVLHLQLAYFEARDEYARQLLTEAQFYVISALGDESNETQKNAEGLLAAISAFLNQKP